MLSPRYTRSLKLILTSVLPSLSNRSPSTRPGGETTCTTISEHGKDDMRVIKRAATCGDGTEKKGFRTRGGVTYGWSRWASGMYTRRGSQGDRAVPNETPSSGLSAVGKHYRGGKGRRGCMRICVVAGASVYTGRVLTGTKRRREGGENEGRRHAF